MRFVLKSISSLNTLVLAGLLATVGASAIAQGAPAAPTPGPSATTMDGHHGGRKGMERHDPAKMQAWIAKRMADMKAKLQITAPQEGAWTAFAAAMQAPAGRDARMTAEQRAEFEKLSTPERIDKMRALRTQHMADMNAHLDKRGDATKALYAALTPEQKNIFDAEAPKRGGHHGMHKG
jgi:Spy/CpxP family protein refolding chaperone